MLPHPAKNRAHPLGPADAGPDAGAVTRTGALVADTDAHTDAHADAHRSPGTHAARRDSGADDRY